MIFKQKQKRFKFNIMRETYELNIVMPELPEDEVFKLISSGNFSSIAFIKMIAEKTIIRDLSATTLRIGKKHLSILDGLFHEKRLINARFVISSLVKNDSNRMKKYGYYENIEEICNNNNWEIAVMNNHSKILLFNTDIGKYVLETSSNLNENPKIEQFSFEKNDELYRFYNDLFDDWFLRQTKGIDDVWLRENINIG
jgi:hypothetical protein